jgi:hypothetical protein
LNKNEDGRLRKTEADRNVSTISSEEETVYLTSMPEKHLDLSKSLTNPEAARVDYEHAPVDLEF